MVGGASRERGAVRIARARSSAHRESAGAVLAREGEREIWRGTEMIVLDWCSLEEAATSRFSATKGGLMRKLRSKILNMQSLTSSQHLQPSGRRTCPASLRYASLQFVSSLKLEPSSLRRRAALLRLGRQGRQGRRPPAKAPRLTERK